MHRPVRLPDVDQACRALAHFPKSSDFDTLSPAMARVRLSSLKLTGFKSFPDEVELTFPSDVSAIIGPNGCGKSNVVDAILWVMGEQSPSLLRLKQMGEVVFAGATGRSPAGAAEVALTLQSDDGHWNETEGRLEIRRRVYRSGPSEYRLNGKNARLKDVLDELLTVGLGTRDYSIIEQGRVGQVLSARPTDRRVLIEEAAGTTRYKRRRHEAQLKLEHTRQNLTRIEDVIGEVTRSLRSLKRQARQAEKHERLRQELRDKVRGMLTLEVHRVAEQRHELSRLRAQAENEVAATSAALGSNEAELSEARTALETRRTEVEAERTVVAELLTSRERLETFVERSSDLIDNLTVSIERTRHDSASLKSTRTELDERLGVTAARAGSLAEALEQVRQRVAEAEHVEAETRESLRAAETAAESQRQELLRTISRLTTTRNRLGETEREQDRVGYALNQLEHERERLVGRGAEVGERADAAIESSRAAAAVAEELAEQRRQLAAQRSALVREENEAKQHAESLGRELWELRHRLVGVERDLARHTAAADQIVEVVPERSLVGQVSDFLHPEQGMAPVMERVWHDWLELPVIDSAGLDSGQLAALASLEERIRLVVASAAPPPQDHPNPPHSVPLFERAGIATEHLPWLARTLPAAYLCDDGEQARLLAEQHPNAVFVGSDNVVWRGRTMEPPTAGTRLRGVLALRDDRRELKAGIERASAQAEASTSRHGEISARIAELEQRVVALDGRLVQAEQERARTAAVEGSLREERARLERECEAVDAEISRNRTLQDDLKKRQAKLEHEVAAISSRNEELERTLEIAGATLDGERDAANEALRRLDHWRAEARLAGERDAAARADVVRLETEAATLDHRIAKLESDATTLAADLTRTEDEVVQSRARLVEEHGSLASARDRERQLTDAVQQAATKVEQLDREVRQRREEHERAREQLHALEVDQTRLDSSWDRLRESAAGELHTTPEELLQEEPVEEEDLDALDASIESLRTRLENMGPVNLLALRELQELEERATFLKCQRNDLVDALGKLDATVREIDEVCTERFVNTLEQVNTFFHETFNSLFGGGSACLELVDPDDPLESGIDITAQPPGKKTQSVQLLSGGEKALTALALLISLFRIRPSPFCVLDEVDAPLDDANVERLIDLIHAMTEHTQFVLITHNRRTMQRAEVLYGVTMERPGVSKLVSVRLEE
jgi:chromosome segregation protein